jgi:hypothetical protein
VPRLRRHARGGYTERFYAWRSEGRRSISERPATTTSSTGPRSRAATPSPAVSTSNETDALEASAGRRNDSGSHQALISS